MYIFDVFFKRGYIFGFFRGIFIELKGYVYYVILNLFLLLDYIICNVLLINIFNNINKFSKIILIILCIVRI